MRNIFLLILTLVVGFMVACDHHDTLPPYSAPTIFNVTKMTHPRSNDTIKSSGDVLLLVVKGGIYDTSRKYAISASVKAADSANDLLASEYIKSSTVTFDTVGYASSNLYRWIDSITLPLPRSIPKIRFKPTVTFTFGLNLSSQMGNTVVTDSSYVYTK
jgi:hypothetical protein